jgi:hypothetical protein
MIVRQAGAHNRLFDVLISAPSSVHITILVNEYGCLGVVYDLHRLLEMFKVWDMKQPVALLAPFHFIGIAQL